MLEGEERDASRTEGFSRRGVLAAALTGGVAAMLPASGAAAASSSVARAASSGTGASSNATQFFTDPSLNFQALFPLSAAAYGASQPGEVLEVFNRVHARGDAYGAYYEEFLAEGKRLHGVAERAARGGHRVTARDSYMRAAMYYDQALYFVLASSRPTRAHEGEVYRLMEANLRPTS